MRTRLSAHRSGSRKVVALCIFAAVIGAAAVAHAQGQYEQWPPDPNLNNWAKITSPSNERRAIEGMLRGSLDEAKFDAFFNGVIFPQFTLPENIFYTSTVKGSKTLKNTTCLLPAMRKQFKDLFYKPANQQVRDRLNMLTLKAMTKIAAGNYHPIARYNAMLLIADLNQDEEAGTPYPQALNVMVSAARSPRVIDGVRVAALIGIVRHAKSTTGIDPAMKDLVTGVVTQLITDNKRPADRSPEGHDWMRRRALEALTVMNVKTPPTDGTFLQLLNTLLQEKGSTMELRAEAVESFLTVTFPAPATFDSAKMATGIGQVAVDAYRGELLTSSQFGRPVDGKGIEYYFTLVDKGLAALHKLAPSPKIPELQTALATLVEEATAEEEVDPELGQPDPLFKERQYDKIAQSGAQFESLVSGKPVSEILPKRGPVGGNIDTGAAGFTGGAPRGPGYGAASDRGGGMRLPPGVGGPRGGRGYGVPGGGRR